MSKITEKWIDDGAVGVAKIKATNSPTAGQIPERDASDPTKVVWVDKPTGGTDGKDVKVSAGDTTPGFLDGKITVAAGKMTKTKNGAGGNETLELNVGADIFDKTTDDSGDVTEGVNLFFTNERADARITAQKGQANGLAELDSGGKVPSAQLPAFVDDVIEVADFASLPGTGETGKIYITIDDGKTFRWSGSVYAEISESLALGETSSTAYRGDRGKIAYDHSQTAHAPSNAEANRTPVNEVLTLGATDITNKYKDLANIPAVAAAVLLIPVGGPAQLYTTDFTVISDGADVKRLNWNGLGLDGVLEDGDKLMVSYQY